MYCVCACAPAPADIRVSITLIFILIIIIITTTTNLAAAAAASLAAQKWCVWVLPECVVIIADLLYVEVVGAVYEWLRRAVATRHSHDADDVFKVALIINPHLKKQQQQQ